MKCSICGKYMDSPDYSGKDFGDVCTDCFVTRYWDLIVKEKSEHVIIDGNCYYIGPEHAKGFRGYSGRRFHIHFFDGREDVITTNLWDNGKIPDSHRDRLPDTAKFINDVLNIEKEY